MVCLCWRALETKTGWWINLLNSVKYSTIAVCHTESKGSKSNDEKIFWS